MLTSVEDWRAAAISQEKDYSSLKAEVFALIFLEKGNETQRKKGKIHPFECRVPKNSKER